jgi:hypothetical protein
MYNSQSEEMHIMVLHKDGFTIPGLNLAMFILRTWHLTDVVAVCAFFSLEVYTLPNGGTSFSYCILLYY